MRPGFLVFGLIVFFTDLGDALGASALYPLNPSVTRDAIYVSSEGVSRFDRQALKLVWRALEGVHTFEPVVTKAAILIGSPAGLYALDPASGKTRWHLPSDATLFSPAVAQGIAFVGGEDGSLRAVAIDTGRVVWRRRFAGWVYPPAIVRGHLIVGGSGGWLRGMDVETGEIRWEKPLSQEMVYRPVAIPGGRTVVTTFSGEVLMLSAADGRTIWRAEDRVPSFPPAAAEGRLYFGGFDGNLRVRDQTDGKLRWMRPVGDRLSFTPRVANGVALVGSKQGQVTAFRTQTGEQLWGSAEAEGLVGSPVLMDDTAVLFFSTRRPALRPIASLPESHSHR